jgi:thiol-disulfide isomerase/thioredoxin
MRQRNPYPISSAVSVLLILLCMSIAAAGQKPSAAAPAKAITIMQIDNDGLRKTLTPGTKPLLINFWATWCVPCREEFPDLVKLDAEYRGKIDFLTISLDDVADMKTEVPKFLSEMKAEMPAYLLKAQDEDAAIALVSKDFTGALPFTILLKPGGGESYIRAGKVDLVRLRGELDKLLVPAAQAVSK